MAYRGGAVAAAGSGTTQVITVSGIGIALNDIVLLAVTNPSIGIGSPPTFPSGFAVVPGTTSAPNDGNTSVIVFWKLATGSEPTTYTIGNCNFGQAVTCRVYSGRNTTSPFTTNQPTTNLTNPTSVVTFAVAGVTAAASDDVVIFIGDQFQSVQASATYAPAASFANGLLALDTSNGNWEASSDHVNVSAGATGSIAGTLTFATNGTNYLAQVISIASSSGGGGTPFMGQICL